MKPILIFSLSLLFISSLSAQSKEEGDVIEASKKKFRLMIEMKLDSLEGVLDDRLVFTHSNGWTENKKELIQDIKSGKLRYQSIESRDIIVRLYPKTAILTGKGKFKVVLDGNELLFDLAYTEIYVMKCKKWLLASRHSNRMP
jgi:hypothetical protein